MKTSRLIVGMVVILSMAFAPVDAKAHKGHKGHHSKHRHGTYTPYWVPKYMIRENIRHVYFPDFDLYFDRWEGTYIYLDRGRWIVSTYLPYPLRRVDFDRAYKVGLSTPTSRPYRYHERYRAYYQRYYRHPRHDRDYYRPHKGHKKHHQQRREDFRYDESRDLQRGNRSNERRGRRSN